MNIKCWMWWRHFAEQVTVYDDCDDDYNDNKIFGTRNTWWYYVYCIFVFFSNDDYNDNTNYVMSMMIVMSMTKMMTIILKRMTMITMRMMTMTQWGRSWDTMEPLIQHHQPPPCLCKINTNHCAMLYSSPLNPGSMLPWSSFSPTVNTLQWCSCYSFSALLCSAA